VNKSLEVDGREVRIGKSGRPVYQVSPAVHGEIMRRFGGLPVVDIEDWVAEKRGKEVLPERLMLRHVRDSAWGLVTELFGVHVAGPCMCKACEYARVSADKFVERGYERGKGFYRRLVDA